MKKIILLTLSCMIIIAGLLAAISCGTSTQTTTTAPGTGTQVKPPPGSTTGPDFKPAAVTIENLAFSPASLTVPIGTTVTWTNNDATAHTVTSKTGLFDSGIMNRGDTFSYTFNDQGVFEYHCTIHTTMNGTVTVE
jgi:plastocyanin